MFVLYGATHIATLALIFSSGAALSAIVRTRSGARHAKALRLGLASALIANWGLWFALLFENAWISISTVLPMNLCDWTTAAAIFTLLSPNQSTYDLAYFWTFGGTLQALLTPDLTAGFPDPRFLIFFGLHGITTASVIFLTLGLRMRPRPASLPRVAFWSLVYLIAALSVNRIFGTNFGYLHAKPMHASILDYFAPWPYYIGEMILLGLVFCAFFYSPYFVFDRLARRRQARTSS